MYIEESVLVGLTALAVKIADYIYNLIKSKIIETDAKKIETVDEKIAGLKIILDELSNVLSKTDDDGVHLVYFPRKFSSQQDLNIDLVKANTHHSEMIVKTLDKLVQSIDGMSRILDRLDYKTHR